MKRSNLKWDTPKNNAKDKRKLYSVDKSTISMISAGITWEAY